MTRLSIKSNGFQEGWRGFYRPSNRPLSRRFHGLQDLRGKVAGSNHIALGQNHGPLDGVFQLAHVSGQEYWSMTSMASWLKLFTPLLFFFLKSPKNDGPGGGYPPPFPAVEEGQGDHIQPGVKSSRKVFRSTASRRLMFVAATIRTSPDGFGPSQALKLPHLENPKEFYLDRGAPPLRSRQKEGSPLASSKRPSLRAMAPVKAPVHTEELRFQQRLRRAAQLT